MEPVSPTEHDHQPNMNASDQRLIDDATCHRLVRQLVEIESHSGQEAAAVDFLVEQLETLGYHRCYRDAAGNAVGIRGLDEAATTVVLLGHIDTVPGHIPVSVDDGKLHGRGSVDAKGPLATLALAAAQVEPPPHVRLVVVGAVEEESATSKGARQIARDFTADFCVIGEPSGTNAITLGYKGRLLAEADFVTDMGHSAGPQPSAPELAAAFWQSILEYCQQFNKHRPRLFDQLLPSLRSINSCSDGLMSTARCRIGIRLPPDFEMSAFQSRLQDLADSAGQPELRIYGCEPACRADRSNLLCRSLAAAIRHEGLQTAYKLKTGTADMNVVAPIWNCPILAYGPGDSSLDHSPHEHLDLAEYVQAVRILTGGLNRLMPLIPDRSLYEKQN
jgi:LysW-gamma-L-lysine carboxypeptidase